MSKFNETYILKMDDITKDGDPILRKKIKEVTLPISKETKGELLCMMKYLKNSQDEILAKKYNLRSGVGISGNQIGLDKRMFATFFEDENGKVFEYMLVNPKIISHSTIQTHLPDGEGCLSVDEEILGHVPRYQKITVKALTIDGEEIILKLKDYAAIVFQHEIDHLNGIMFFDRINKEKPFLNVTI